MSTGDHALIAEAVIGKRASESGWIRCNCPLCVFREGKEDRKRSLGFSVLSLRYECYRCGAKGRLRDAPEEYDLPERDDATKEEAPLFVEPPEHFYPLAGDDSEALAPARDFLRYDRPRGGVPEESIAKFGIGACVGGRYAGRVVIPVFAPDGSGRWRWLVARSWVKKVDQPYLYPFGARHGLMFNEQALDVETDEPLLVMEGCFDAIAHDPHAVAVLGKTTDEHVDMLVARARRPVVLVPDGDEWESGYAIAMRLRLAGLRAGSLRLPAKVDPDELSREELRAAALEALDGAA